jgi:type IV secretory pathway VirB2 component (pilin)
MLETIKGFFESLYGRFNGYLQDLLDIDNRLIGLYNDFVAPLPELIKLVGIVFVGFILVFGTIGFVKKMLKLFIVLAVILAIVFFITRLNN